MRPENIVHQQALVLRRNGSEIWIESGGITEIERFQAAVARSNVEFVALIDTEFELRPAAKAAELCDGGRAEGEIMIVRILEVLEAETAKAAEALAGEKLS